MKLVEINWTPSDRQLRQFGVICLVALPLVAWLWGGGTQVIAGTAVAGLVLAIAGWFVPRTIKPIFLLLTIVATPIGMVIGEFAMMAIYFGVFLPIGLIFRLIGRDALQRTIDRDQKTYWQPKEQPKDAASYYRQS